jgi:hypothetical protein
MLLTADDYNDRRRLADHLGAQMIRGRLALLLGAGVSIPFGLPSWSELLVRLYATVGALPPKNRDVKRQADHFRRKFCDNDEQRLAEAVRSVLYKGAKTSANKLRRNATISALGALVMASKRGSVSNVITFNYDDLLEQYLGFFGFVATSVYDEIHWAADADVVIYHPHGFLPAETRATASKDIVLGQRSYTRLAAQERNFWRQELLTVLRTHICLFVGLSGLDEHLELLLEQARSAHAILRETPTQPYWGVSFALDSDEISPDEWEERGIWCHRVTSYEKDLPTLIFEVCQAAAKARIRT